ncbi:MAG: PAS domain-containing protein [Ignavibacteriae bacterium]|nr:PAS domain-containing protein [Ignavibacteriota bacterium]
MDWIKEFNGAVTLCNTEGTITYMNNKALKTFENDGGDRLIGTNVLDCHPEPSKSVLKDLMMNQKSNVYTIEKNSVKKLIYQSPVFTDGKYSGFVEISLEIPIELPNFIRK